MYELINYSDHGTIVDNIVYTLNPVNPGFGDAKAGDAHSSSAVAPKTLTNNNTTIHSSDKGKYSLAKRIQYLNTGID